MENNSPLRVEFCPKKYMMRNGFIPGRQPQKSDDDPCRKALHYQEQQWKWETYTTHIHKPGLKGKLPPENIITPFSGRMADLELVPTGAWAFEEQDQIDKPSQQECEKCWYQDNQDTLTG